MRRVKVAALPVAGELDPGTSHHLRHVLRLAVGTPLIAFDGAGHTQQVQLTPSGLEPSGPVQDEPPPPAVDLIVSVLKHNAMDLALRMATEAGVRRILPVITERTVAKGDRGPRWQRLITSACEQCQRSTEPVLEPVRPLREVLDSLQDVTLCFGQQGAGRPAIDGPVALVIGPAGGLSPREEHLLLKHGAHPVGLGPYVLRAETACAVGVSALLGDRHL